MYDFIVNPHSRSGKARAYWEEVRRVLDARHIPYTAHLTQYAGHAVQIAHELSADGTERTIVAMGGDGTLNEVLTGLQSFDHVTLGYLPTGSGNDFARGLGIRRPPLEMLGRLLSSPSVRRLDVGEVTLEDGTVRRFADSCGIGYDAQVCRDLLSSRVKTVFNALHIGKLAYLAIGVGAFFRHRFFSGTLIPEDGAPVPLKKIFFLSFQNLPYEGGGYRFAPDADPADGKLSVCCVSGYGKPTLLPIMLSSRSGGHIGSRAVRTFEGRRFCLEVSAPAALHTDGEVLPLSQRIELTVRPQVLRFLA